MLYPIKTKNVNGNLQPVSKLLPVSSGFGPRGSGFHNGIDIPIPVGSELQAPFDGTIKYYTNSKGGNQVIITSTDQRRRFGYAHLKDLTIPTRIGQGGKVTAGQVVGLSGNTGNSTGPHLHLTYTENNELKDPAKQTYSFNGTQNTQPNPNPLVFPLPKIDIRVISLILVIVILAIYLIKNQKAKENVTLVPV